METTSENIRQLLEMLDNPDAYTEQEIRTSSIAMMIHARPTA